MYIILVIQFLLHKIKRRKHKNRNINSKRTEIKLYRRMQLIYVIALIVICNYFIIFHLIL